MVMVYVICTGTAYVLTIFFPSRRSKPHVLHAEHKDVVR